MTRVTASRVAAGFGLRAVGAVERVAQHAQGKGWGSSTVKEEVAAVRGFLGPIADERCVIFDVGANVGNWTREALSAFPQAEIHSVEPSSAASAQFSAEIGNNPRVCVHRVAFADREDQMILYADKPGSGIASLTERRILGVNLSHRESVSVRTLAGFAEDHEITRIDVLKMDVEGHELDVLRGAGDLLSTTRVIQFEFGGANIDTRTYFRDFWYLLTDVGFQLYRLGPRVPHPVSAYNERDEVFVTTNFFAVAHKVRDGLL